MPSTNNKVKFGLKNCHYAKATLDPDTNAVTGRGYRAVLCGRYGLLHHGSE